METSAPLADRFRELRVALDAIPDVSEPPKSTLRILGMARREQQWNTLLTYFLDPAEPHGFGTALLERFLDVVAEHSERNLDYYHRDFESVRVDTEITSPQNNRLDIAIRVADEWFVWVELKVDANEGHRQTARYVQDTYIGNEEKADYPESGHHYVFVSKRFTPDATAAGFVDIAWQDVVEAFQEELRRSQGRYPERSVGQLSEFLATIRTVTHMVDDDFTETQKEKVRLLGCEICDLEQPLFLPGHGIDNPADGIHSDGAYLYVVENPTQHQPTGPSEWAVRVSGHARFPRWEDRPTKPSTGQSGSSRALLAAAVDELRPEFN